MIPGLSKEDLISPAGVATVESRQGVTPSSLRDFSDVKSAAALTARRDRYCQIGGWHEHFTIEWRRSGDGCLTLGR